MNPSPPKVVASAYMRLAPVFGASLARGSSDLHTVASRLPGSDAFMASVIYCGTAAEARHEAILIREAAKALGFKLEGGVQDLMGVTAHVEAWPEAGHLLTFTWNRRPTPASPSRPVAEAAA